MHHIGRRTLSRVAFVNIHYRYYTNVPQSVRPCLLLQLVIMMTVLAALRHLRHLRSVLRSDMTLPDAGAVMCPKRSLFVGRTHFHIFGLFFPLVVSRISVAVSVIFDLYSSVSLLRHVDEPTHTGNGVTVITRSRYFGDDDVTMSAQKWSVLFEQESETLQR